MNLVTASSESCVASTLPGGLPPSATPAEFFGSFRVCTTRGSGLLLCRLGLGLGPLGPDPRRLPAPRFVGDPGTANMLPSWTSQLPRSAVDARSNLRLPLERRGHLFWTPLLRFFCPPAHEDGGSYRRRLCRDRLATSSPFLTTSTSSSAPIRPEISPGHAHGLCSLQGFFRCPTRDRRLRRSPPLLVFLNALGPSDRSFPVRVAGPPGVHRTSFVTARFWFPVCGGRSPPGFSF
jgi:hypothetical protein